MAMVKDYLHNKFKHGIDAGILQYGVAQETTSADVAEILATSKYDWLFVDGEHGPHTVQTILAVARAVAPFDMTPVVRIPQAGVITIATQIILTELPTNFVSCRKLKVNAVMKT